MVATDSAAPNYRRKSSNLLSASRERGGCWHPICWRVSGNESPPWILSRGSHSPPRKWKRSTPVCSITWRDPSQKSGLRIPGPTAGTEHSPGQITSLCVGLEQPEGRVHFAGEHISVWPYWMQGALQSGLRAAKEVHEAGVIVG
jgi:hypothetical protein